ncbi:GNAT family N-acetyltransferase [Chryseobacterium sp. MP_3.2]|uniref:GNAT family N-acetyltransferase n=1 Tax=Chryseobacterium sp. MP_3.2 TaxID=3071712 RepID=UPI002DFEAA20|nr:ribosomal-protein-alanine N-acetyltransferase [Chryseobacterium sp. MP_3.2]
MNFSTDRLIFRPITEYDAAYIFQIRSNPSINQFLHRNPPQNSFEALDFILGIKMKTELKEIVFFGISLKSDYNLIGTICFWNFSNDRKTAELGYELLPEFQGKGIMSEAIHFMLRYGGNELSLNEIEAFTNKENLNSIKLLEQFNFVLNASR